MGEIGFFFVILGAKKKGLTTRFGCDEQLFGGILKGSGELIYGDTTFVIKSNLREASSITDLKIEI